MWCKNISHPQGNVKSTTMDFTGASLPIGLACHSAPSRCESKLLRLTIHQSLAPSFVFLETKNRLEKWIYNLHLQTKSRDTGTTVAMSHWQWSKTLWLDRDFKCTSFTSFRIWLCDSKVLGPICLYLGIRKKSTFLSFYQYLKILYKNQKIVKNYMQIYVSTFINSESFQMFWVKKKNEYTCTVQFRLTEK